MAVFRKDLLFSLNPDGILDITKEIEEVVGESGIKEGICNVFAVGSTAAVITTEYEEGHLKDLLESLEIIAPSNKDYEHHKAWHDDNGKSHVRAVFLQQDLTFPIAGGKPMLGTWQNVCLINLDTRRRERRVIISVLGD